jgi:hypothetical protein
MDRDAVGRLNYQQLKALEGLVREALGEKQLDAEKEYREKARALADAYGFSVMGKAGRPKKRAKTKPERGNGHDGDNGALAEPRK